MTMHIMLFGQLFKFNTEKNVIVKYILHITFKVARRLKNFENSGKLRLF